MLLRRLECLILPGLELLASDVDDSLVRLRLAVWGVFKSGSDT
jgi:hypothetical protein